MADTPYNQLMALAMRGLNTAAPQQSKPASKIDALQPAEFPHMTPPQQNFLVTGMRPEMPRRDLSQDPAAASQLHRANEAADLETVMRPEYDRLKHEQSMYAGQMAQRGGMAVTQGNAKFTQKAALAGLQDQAWQNAELSGFNNPGEMAQQGRAMDMLSTVGVPMEEGRLNRSHERGMQGSAQRHDQSMQRGQFQHQDDTQEGYQDFQRWLFGQTGGAGGAGIRSFNPRSGAVSFQSPTSQQVPQGLAREVQDAFTMLQQSSSPMTGQASSAAEANYRMAVGNALARMPYDDGTKSFVQIVAGDPELRTLPIDQLVQHPKILGQLELIDLTPEEISILEQALQQVRGVR